MSVAARNRASDLHDTYTAAGKAFLDMLAVFAEFETNLPKEQQAERIAAAKARGVYKGRRLLNALPTLHRCTHRARRP